MKNTRIFIYIILSCLPIGLLAQTDISMATSWYNRGNYNPASIARPDYIYLFSNYRNQWAGVDGAPTVYNVQASLYSYPMKSAFGISVVDDQIGITNSFNPMLTYAYRISGEEWALSFGLSLGVFNRTIDVSQYSAVDDDDQALYETLEATTKPDANVGVEFQNRHFILGASTTHLFSIGKQENIYLNSNHRYLYGIYKNTNPELFSYYLGMQVVNHYNIFETEGSAIVRLKAPTGLMTGSRELIDLGVKYTSTSEMTALFGVNISSQLRVGYAYEYTFHTGYSKNGTHEVMLEYRIPFKSDKCVLCHDGSGDWYR